MEDHNNFREMPINWLDRLSDAFIDVGRAAQKCADTNKQMLDILIQDHARRTKMYCRRAYRHGSIK